MLRAWVLSLRNAYMAGENVGKYVSFSTLPPTKKVIEPQILHDFLVPITPHGISKD